MTNSHSDKYSHTGEDVHSHPVCSTFKSAAITATPRAEQSKTESSTPSFEDTFDSIRKAYSSNLEYYKSVAGVAQAEFYLARRALMSVITLAFSTAMLGVVLLVSINFLAYQIILALGASNLSSAAVVVAINVVILIGVFVLMNRRIKSVSMRATLSAIFSSSQQKQESPGA